MGCSEAKTGARLAELLALEYGVPPDEARQIRTAAALRDIGMQKIPAGILHKPGKLTGRELNIIKNHTRIGADMLADIQGELGVMARNICLHHHEYYDGGGYWGKNLCILPYYVEIAAIAGAYTSLVSGRPYRRAFTPIEARRHIKTLAGTRFSRGLTEIFFQLVKNGDRVPALFVGG